MIKLQLIGLPPTDHDGDQITYLGAWEFYGDQVLEIFESDEPILCMIELAGGTFKDYTAIVDKCDRDGTSPRILFMDSQL